MKVVLHCIVTLCPTNVKGPSIKHVTLEGEGVQEGATVCDRGLKEHVASHLSIFYHSYETWNL